MAEDRLSRRDREKAARKTRRVVARINPKSRSVRQPGVKTPSRDDDQPWLPVKQRVRYRRCRFAVPCRLARRDGGRLAPACDGTLAVGRASTDSKAALPRLFFGSQVR